MCPHDHYKLYAIACASLTLASTCFAQPDATSTKGSNAPYKEGPVWALTMIKTKTGLGDEYLKQITGTVKPVYDEEKKQKIIPSTTKFLMERPPVLRISTS